MSKVIHNNIFFNLNQPKIFHLVEYQISNDDPVRKLSKILEAMNFNKENAVIIGDSLSSDIQGGANTGVKTIWFNPKREENNSSVKPDYEVSDLKEIEKLLEKI